MVRLDVYVEEGCLACRRSLRLAEYVRQRFPDVKVRVIDVAAEQGDYSHLVVATPTFVLNGETFSLGNPSQTELATAIAALRAKEDRQ